MHTQVCFCECELAKYRWLSSEMELHKSRVRQNEGEVNERGGCLIIMALDAAAYSISIYLA